MNSDSTEKEVLLTQNLPSQDNNTALSEQSFASEEMAPEEQIEIPADTENLSPDSEIPQAPLETGFAPSPPPAGNRRAFLALMFLIVFLAGCLTGGVFTHLWDTRPDTARQEGDSSSQSASEAPGEIEKAQALSSEEYKALETKLSKLNELSAEYQEKRLAEIVPAVLEDEAFDMEALLESDFFQDAWETYLEDMLTAFSEDERINGWLYSYYRYSLERGSNAYINEDLWIYDNSGNEEGIFSSDLTDYASFRQNRYDASLYDHMFRDGRIYITAIDFLDYVLRLEDYAVNGAVFAAAFGGSPNPEEMNIPGWPAQNYDAFWNNASEYYYSGDPVWTNYKLSAENFNIDWNLLANEQAYYDAYSKLMDTIAPGLPRYGLAEYYGSDDVFGGMGYGLVGKEASPKRIAALYLETHPDTLEESGIDLTSFPSSFDDKIREIESSIKKVTEMMAELENH